MNESRFLLATVILLLVTGCTTAKIGTGDSCDAPSWVRYLPYAESQRFSVLDRARYRLIEGSLRDRAIRRLDAVPVYEADSAEAQQLGFTSIPQGMKIFVVRAVGLSIQGGSWRVRENGDALEIEYGVLTRIEPTMTCQPLAVLLAKMPTQIFARASSAG